MDYPANRARQSEVEFHKTWQRATLFAALFGGLLVLIVVLWLMR